MTPWKTGKREPPNSPGAFQIPNFPAELWVWQVHVEFKGYFWDASSFSPLNGNFLVGLEWNLWARDESLSSIPVLLISLLWEDPERRWIPCLFQRKISLRNRILHFQKFGMFGKKKFLFTSWVPALLPHGAADGCAGETKGTKKKWNKSRWRNVWNDSLGIKEWQFICAWNLQFLAWKPNCSPIMEIWAGSRQEFNFFRIWAPAREISWSRAGIIRVLQVKDGIWCKSSCLGWDLEGWDLIRAFRWKSRRV